MKLIKLHYVRVVHLSQYPNLVADLFLLLKREVVFANNLQRAHLVKLFMTHKFDLAKSALSDVFLYHVVFVNVGCALLH